MIDAVIEAGLIIVLLCYLIQWRQLEKRYVKVCKELLNQNNTLTEELEVLKAMFSEQIAELQEKVRVDELLENRARAWRETEGGCKYQVKGEFATGTNVGDKLEEAEEESGGVSV